MSPANTINQYKVGFLLPPFSREVVQKYDLYLHLFMNFPVSDVCSMYRENKWIL